MMEEESKSLVYRLKRQASGESESFEEEWVTESVDLMNEAARDLTAEQARIVELEAALRELITAQHEMDEHRPLWTSQQLERVRAAFVAARAVLEKPCA